MSEDLLRILRRKFRTTNQIHLVFRTSFKRSENLINQKQVN